MGSPAREEDGQRHAEGHTDQTAWQMRYNMAGS
jgi:hypothetical protein